MKTKKIIIFLALAIFFIFFLPNLCFAQSNEEDFIRSIGKIYVVVAVIVTIFIGLVVYIFSLDRKLKNIENQIKNYE